MLPIPGISSVEHLEENFAPASAPKLTDRRITALDLSGESRRSVNIGASVVRFGLPAG
jgi:aryl-alcohol dehydrogenase-like predicted oxidoreductase